MFAKYAIFLCLGTCFLSPLLSLDDDMDLTDMSLEQLLDMPIQVASQFEETELEAGATVEIITRDQWQAFGAEHVEEAIVHQPSVMAYPTAWGGSAVAIRGYATSLSVRGIATVIDGVPLNSFRTGSALYEMRTNVLQSLDQIEMIRGTASALYGSDAFHGVISLKTYAREENFARAGVSFSTENHRQADLGFTRVLGGGARLNISLAGVDQGDQDIPFRYTSPFTRTEGSAARENSYDAYTAVIKLNLQHSDPWSSELGVYLRAHDSLESVSAGRSLSGNSILTEFDVTDGESSNQMFRAGTRWQGPNHLVFEGKFYSWHTEIESYTDLTSIPSLGFVTKGEQEEDLYGADLVLKQTENRWNTQWAVGLSFKHNEIPVDNAFALNRDRQTLAQLPSLWTGLDRDVQSLVFEGRTRLLKDRLQFIFGNRYDDYSDFGGQNSPRLGIIWLPNTNMSFKLLYGEAFRAPIAAEIVGTGTFQGNPELNPETTDTLELAYTYKAKNWKLILTGYRSKWTDGITLIPIVDDNFTSRYANVGQNESQGFEIGFEGGIGAWRWNLNGSVVDSEAVTPQGDVPYGAFPGQILNAIFGYHFEKQHLQLNVTNRFLFDMDEGPAIRLIPEPAPLDDYSSTDLSLTWQPNQRFDVQVVIKNSFDQTNSVPSIWNAENGQPELGRQARLRLAYRF